MTKAGMFQHVFERRTDEGEWEHVGSDNWDTGLYGTSRYAWEVAEEILASYHRLNQLPDGTYRVRVLTFQGQPYTELERELPLPPEWAALPIWPDHNRGEVSRAHAGRLLAAYPGAGMELIGRCARTFSDHYTGMISTAQLTEHTGYVLPPGVPRPHASHITVPEENV